MRMLLGWLKQYLIWFIYEVKVCLFSAILLLMLLMRPMAILSYFSSQRLSNSLSNSRHLIFSDIFCRSLLILPIFFFFLYSYLSFSFSIFLNLKISQGSGDYDSGDCISGDSMVCIDSLEGLIADIFLQEDYLQVDLDDWGQSISKAQGKEVIFDRKMAFLRYCASLLNFYRICWSSLWALRVSLTQAAMSLLSWPKGKMSRCWGIRCLGVRFWQSQMFLRLMGLSMCILQFITKHKENHSQSRRIVNMMTLKLPSKVQ